MAEWRRFPGFVSYSYTVGNAWYPVTGGLFLGEDSHNPPAGGHFPDISGSAKHPSRPLALSGRARLWIAGGVQYDCGLPFQFQGDPATLSLNTVQQVLDRIISIAGAYPAFR